MGCDSKIIIVNIIMIKKREKRKIEKIKLLCRLIKIYDDTCPINYS